MVLPVNGKSSLWSKHYTSTHTTTRNTDENSNELHVGPKHKTTRIFRLHTRINFSDTLNRLNQLIAFRTRALHNRVNNTTDHTVNITHRRHSGHPPTHPPRKLHVEIFRTFSYIFIWESDKWTWPAGTCAESLLSVCMYHFASLIMAADTWYVTFGKQTRLWPSFAVARTLGVHH